MGYKKITKKSMGIKFALEKEKFPNLNLLPLSSILVPSENILTMIDAFQNDLEEKFKQICEMYPKPKVCISLLLPTRLTPLNHRVHDFNNRIMDMTCRMSRVCIIEHSLFGDHLTDEHGRWKKELESSSVYTPKNGRHPSFGKIRDTYIC